MPAERATLTSPSPCHVVVMGVSGSGKSTVARAAAGRLGWVFGEGDDFHPAANLAKMAAGVPLDDADRAPWLDALASWTRDHDLAGRDTVLSCSALRRAYRDVLRTGGDRTCFVHLTADAATLLERMRSREHFMPPALLESQLATLEPLSEDEVGLTVNAADPLDTILVEVLAWLDLRRWRAG